MSQLEIDLFVILFQNKKSSNNGEKMSNYVEAKKESCDNQFFWTVLPVTHKESRKR
jgi:hypothetical protein